MVSRCYSEAPCYGWQTSFAFAGHSGMSMACSCPAVAPSTSFHWRVRIEMGSRNQYCCLIREVQSFGQRFISNYSFDYSFLSPRRNLGPGGSCVPGCSPIARRRHRSLEGIATPWHASRPALSGSGRQLRQGQPLICALRGVLLMRFEALS